MADCGVKMRYLQDLKKIVEINSYTKNKSGVDKVSAIMSSWLKEIGFEDHIFKRELIGDHHLYTTKKEKHLPNILLVGHNDTVFEPGSFEGFSEDSKWVYGAGVCDMKGGNIVALEALRNLHKKRKITNIDFLLVSDEETGSDDSKFISQKIAKDYDYCFVFEASGKDLEVVTARKGVGTFKIDIEGKASHAGTSYKDGIDANLELSYKLQELVKLTNLDIGTTVNVGKIEGGIGANTISPKASLLFEIRYEIESEKERLLKAINKITKPFIKGSRSTPSGQIQRDVMQENNKQLQFIEYLQKTSRGFANYLCSFSVIAT